MGLAAATEAVQDATQALQDGSPGHSVREDLTGAVEVLAVLGAHLREVGQAPTRGAVSRDDLALCREAASLGNALLCFARDTYRQLGVRWEVPR